MPLLLLLLSPDHLLVLWQSLLSYPSATAMLSQAALLVLTKFLLLLLLLKMCHLLLSCLV